MEATVKLLDLQVNVSEEYRLGQFANAFRIVDDHSGGPECLLDFLVYSGSEGTASVVSRIRVRRAFLPVLRAQLDRVLSEILITDVHSCWMSQN